MRRSLLGKEYAPRMVERYFWICRCPKASFTIKLKCVYVYCRRLWRFWRMRCIKGSKKRSPGRKRTNTRLGFSFLFVLFIDAGSFSVVLEK